MKIAWLGTALGILALAAPASAQGVVNVYCSVQVEWCTLVANEFQKATGVKVSMTQKGSGETIAQLKAEAQNPKGDVWFGGTGDPHLQAAEEGLTRGLQVAASWPSCIPGRSSRIADSGGKTVGIYAGALGFGFNTELLAKKNCQGAGLLGRPAQARVQGRNPDGQSELVGHRLCGDRHAGAAHGRGQGVRLSQEAARQHQRLHALRHRADEGGGARRDRRRHQLRA